MDDPYILPLHKLNGAVSIQLETALEFNNAWHAVAAELHNIVTLEGCQRNSVTSAKSLMQQLCMKEFTVGQLAETLDLLQLEKPLTVLREHEPVKIDKHPQKLIAVYEGPNNVLELVCRASGFPYPHYQWLKKGLMSRPNDYFKELPNQTLPILKVSPVSIEDSGIYKCQVYNKSEASESVEFSNESIVRVSEDRFSQLNSSSLPDLPIIFHQPVAPAAKLAIGASFSLKVVASCKHPLKYKWYKNDRELNGATGEQLIIERLEPEGAQNTWSYVCQVSAESGSVMSDKVSISLDVATPKTRYTAKDKVALLIGNGAYTFLDPLRCPINDVTTLADLLSSLDFKVMAFYNLTQQQMIMVINWFCNHLEDGVYAVFYYAGHGYESKKQCYMLPVDAPERYRTQDAVCSNWVHAEIQEHCPALCFILLDMCRKQADGHPDIHSEVREFYSPQAFPNTYLLYATTASRSAFEVKGEPNGIFMKYLKKHVAKDDTLKDIFELVKKEIIADRLAGSQQFPWEEGNLAYERRLTDVIDPSTTVESQKRTDFFKKLNTLPPDTSFMVDEDISVAVKYTKYKQYLQNGLCIILTVTQRANSASLYGAFVTTANADVTWKQGFQMENHTQDVIKHNEIHNLQKLQESLTVDIILQDVINVHLPTHHLLTMDLGKPLIASVLEISK